MLGNVSCMATGPNKLLPFAAASAVVSCARNLRRVLPEDDLSVNKAWNQMSMDTWQQEQSVALIMDLVVSLRKAHDLSPHPICWPAPKDYLAHLRSRERYGHLNYQPPDVGQGSRPAHTPSNRPSGNQAHRHSGVGDNSVARASSHCHADDRDRRCQSGEGTRLAITAGPDVGTVLTDPGPHLGETGLDAGETAARGRRARATGAPGDTTRGEMLLRPVFLAPPPTAAAKPRSRGHDQLQEASGSLAG